MKRILVIVGVLLLSWESSSQAMISTNGGVIYVNKNMGENESLEGRRGGLFGTHHLGDSIGNIYDKFLKLYVEYKSEGGAYATEKKIVYKRPIFDFVEDLDKLMKKQVRKGDITNNEARRRLGKVLQTANTIRFYDTTNLENLLKMNSDIKRKEELFSLIKIEQK